MGDQVIHTAIFDNAVYDHFRIRLATSESLKDEPLECRTQRRCHEMLASRNIMINYGQLIVYLPSVPRPGHLWGDNELEQGFSWSPGIVSLGVPEHAMICLVEIDIIDNFKLSADAICCLRVPFDIFETPIYVGSIFRYEAINIKNGEYSLVYEVLPGRGGWTIKNNGKEEHGDNSYVLKLWFIPGKDEEFKILKAGGSIMSDKVLSKLSELA